MLTACGIETNRKMHMFLELYVVATVLTACGIETVQRERSGTVRIKKLQQCLPLAVLKLKDCGQHIISV